MRVKDLCAHRRLGRNPAATPMVVPSYSSRGFDVGTIFKDTENHCGESKLVSAYDLHYHQIDAKRLYGSPFLFIDSGHYEQKPTHNPGEPYEQRRKGKAWNERAYEKVSPTLTQTRVTSSA